MRPRPPLRKPHRPRPPTRPLPPPAGPGPRWRAAGRDRVPRGVERWKAGHPWIYRADLLAEPTLPGGEAVRVVDGRGWFLGKAFYSSRLEDRPALALLRGRARSTRPSSPRASPRPTALRRTLFPGETTYRVVHGEADLLPGLVVDRYGDQLSAQFLVQATEARRELLADLLVQHFHPRGLMDRSDVGVRTLEGLEPRKEVLRGEVPERVEFAEGLVRVSADLRGGQKTGAFLDQRENHLLSAQYARGKALDCFSYLGGFALQLATRAEHVTAVEISEAASAALPESTSAANGFQNVEVVTANAFDFLRDAVDEGRRFDTIVLDPPSFAKNKGAVEAALRGYKEINLRALQLLAPGGVLMTASCTYHVDEEAFEAMLASAAADARRRVQIVERRGAARDHPVLTALRETRYLKFYVLRVVD